MFGRGSLFFNEMYTAFVRFNLLLFLWPHSIAPFFSHAAEANERAGAGEGLAAGRPGGGGTGPRLVPGPNP